ncbi:hypothetical protein QJK96_16520 [Clostridioides difficile]|nr:hypothetical protein [Clostridioides difficile]
MTNEEFKKLEEICNKYEGLRVMKENAEETKKSIECSDSSKLKFISFNFGWNEDLELRISKETRAYIKQEVIKMLEKVTQDCNKKMEDTNAASIILEEIWNKIGIKKN